MGITTDTLTGSREILDWNFKEDTVTGWEKPIKKIEKTRERVVLMPAWLLHSAGGRGLLK